MHFLSDQCKSMDIIPINLIYHEGEKGKHDDLLDVVYKDLATGKKYVQTIHEPKIEVYIVKPEARNFKHFRDYLPESMLIKKEISYKFRIQELANIMGIDYNEVRMCPYILQSDLSITAHYMMYFLEEYHTDKQKVLSVGFLDIESDIIDFEGFPPIGDPEINAVTYIDNDTEQVFTLLLRNSNNPQIERLENDMEGYKKRLKEKFKENYDSFTFNILYFDREIEMLVTLVQLFIQFDNDYIMAWNLPYDLGSIIERIRRNGYMPEQIFWDKDSFEVPIVEFRPDDNPVAHKRKHISKISIKPVFLDQLVMYAGVRSAKSKLPSLKLSSVAQHELKDDKLDYSEVATIKTLPYVDYEMFCTYNIKDVLLLVSLYRHTNDLNDVYFRCYLHGLMTYEVFTSTTMLTNSIRLYFKTELGLIVGNNRNKIYKSENGGGGIYQLLQSSEEDAEQACEEFDIFGGTGGEDEEESDGASKKKKKFGGAYVSNPVRMQSTGTIINGVESKYVHEHVKDYDVRSEYPTAIIITNASNETFAGKITFPDENIDIPMYSYMLTDDEAESYKAKPEVMFIEIITEKQWENLGIIYFGLPSSEDVVNNFENFIKGDK